MIGSSLRDINRCGVAFRGEVERLVEKGAWLRVVVKCPKWEAEQLTLRNENLRVVGLRFGCFPVVVGGKYLIRRWNDPTWLTWSPGENLDYLHPNPMGLES
jgi:hypothetical protein